MQEVKFDLISQNNDNTKVIIFKTLANTAIHDANKNGLLRFGFSLLYRIEHNQQILSKNIISAFAAFLFNFSIVIIEVRPGEENNARLVYVFARVLKIGFVQD